MIYTAILVACLASAPAECRTVEMRLREWHPMMQAVEAQTWAVEYLKAHPGLVKKDLRVVRGMGV